MVGREAFTYPSSPPKPKFKQPTKTYNEFEAMATEEAQIGK
jgi:hypothetical protein